MPDPAIVFPDVEATVCDRLRTALVARGRTEVRVATKVTGSGFEVWVRRDGGPRLDVVREAARLTVNVYSPTSDATGAQVATLALLVRALLPTFADGAPICAVSETSGPSPVDDSSGRPRRVMGFELIVRGHDLT